MKCIIYDEKEKKLNNFIMYVFDVQHPSIEYSSVNGQTKIVDEEPTINLHGVLDNKPIQLDELTMKKILKYNKSKELERINNDIAYYNEKLKYAKNDYDKYIKKIDEVKKQANNFMNSDCDTFEEMYDEEYYEFGV